MFHLLVSPNGFMRICDVCMCVCLFMSACVCVFMSACVCVCVFMSACVCVLFGMCVSVCSDHPLRVKSSTVFSSLHSGGCLCVREAGCILRSLNVGSSVASMRVLQGTANGVGVWVKCV